MAQQIKMCGGRQMDTAKWWVDLIVELQSLAQAGLAYGKDAYDRERYTRIREISAEMMSHIADIPLEKMHGLFCNEIGYQTPKIDTRAAIFKDNKILLVQEKMEPGLCPAAGVMSMYPLPKTLSRK